MANLIGKTLLERYRVDGYIASGGMSVVYRVWDTERNVPLAMKLLHIDLADDPTIIKRFEREARALQRLAHPHIVPFYGFFQSGDLTFLLEHYVDGPALKQILREKKGPVPIEDVLSYFKAICTALGYAHNNGVVHCDIKPGNVMVDRGGNVYLADFGVARHAESTTTTLGVAGSPAYMAPEQIRGDQVTPASDVYALGVMLFEMLTGQRPFQGTETGSESSGQTAAERVRLAHLVAPVPDPRKFNPSLPEPLVQVVQKAMTKDPQQRFQSALDMLEALTAAMGLSPDQVADRVAPPPVEPEAEIQTLPEGRQKLPAWAWALIGAAIVVVMLCLGLSTGGVQAITDVFASDTPTATRTLIPSKTPTPTATATHTHTPRPTATSTPEPSDTSFPTDTPLPPPTDTPEPPPRVNEPFYTRVWNNRGATIYVRISGRTTMDGTIYPQSFVDFKLNGPGVYTFYWCTRSFGGKDMDCRTKDYNLDQTGKKIYLN